MEDFNRMLFRGQAGPEWIHRNFIRAQSQGLQIFGIDRQGFHDFGVAFDGDDDGAFVDPIAAAGCSGQDLSAIGER
jgi:hypothetical protein